MIKLIAILADSSCTVNESWLKSPKLKRVWSARSALTRYGSMRCFSRLRANNLANPQDRYSTGWYWVQAISEWNPIGLAKTKTEENDMEISFFLEVFPERNQMSQRNGHWDSEHTPWADAFEISRFQLIGMHEMFSCVSSVAKFAIKSALPSRRGPL